MILPIAFAKLARGGVASVAVVPVRPSRKVRRKNGTTYDSQPWQPSRGSHEALLSRSGRSTEKVANVIVGEYRTMQLADLIAETAEMVLLIRRAGCKNRATFADLWMRHYDRGWPILTEKLCPVCQGHKINPDDGQECENCDPVGVILVEDRRSDGEKLDRFKRLHGQTRVHVVHFELDHDDTRFLSPAARPRGDDQGYVTTTDLIDAGASVPLSFQVDMSRSAFEADDARRRRQIEKGELRGLRISESRHDRGRRHREEEEKRRRAAADRGENAA